MSTRESTVSPPEALLNVLVGFWMGRAVYIAAKLGIADLVKDGAKSVEAFKQGEKAFFIYGFAKGERANVSDKELKALKLLAKELFSYSAATLAQAVEAGELMEIEVRVNG